MTTKNLKKEMESKLVAKMQEVVLGYEKEIGKKVRKSIENAADSIAKKVAKYMRKADNKETKAKGEKTKKSTTKVKVKTDVDNTAAKDGQKAEKKKYASSKEEPTITEDTKS